MSNYCPGCSRMVSHWLPDPTYYPGRTFTYICGTMRPDGKECREKITAVIRK